MSMSRGIHDTAKSLCRILSSAAFEPLRPVKAFFRIVAGSGSGLSCSSCPEMKSLLKSFIRGACSMFSVYQVAPQVSRDFYEHRSETYSGCYKIRNGFFLFAWF